MLKQSFLADVRHLFISNLAKCSMFPPNALPVFKIGKGFGHFHRTAYDIASAYALLSKPEDAIKWLENPAEDGFPCYPFFAIDANLNKIRQDKQYVAFMKKLKEQWGIIKLPCNRLVRTILDTACRQRILF